MIKRSTLSQEGSSSFCSLFLVTFSYVSLPLFYKFFASRRNKGHVPLTVLFNFFRDTTSSSTKNSHMRGNFNRQPISTYLMRKTIRKLTYFQTEMLLLSHQILNLFMDNFGDFLSNPQHGQRLYLLSWLSFWNSSSS